ncbi:Guanine deaminase like protein [Verticillium longisporum]|nr:Guanine deaminase like protein [Verticillium longisporum]
MADRPDAEFLRLAFKLAEESLLAGDAPFGSVLVSSSGQILHQDRNRTVTGRHGDGKPDSTYHPEIELARWAQQNLGADERAASVVYTSGEHCAMCTLAHAYCGLGKIVFVSSTNQYRAWLAEFGAPTPQVANLGIADVAPRIPIEGPIDGLVDEVKELQRRHWLARSGQ